MRIWLYDEDSAPTLKVEIIAGRLRSELPRAEVAVRGEFVAHHLGAARSDPARLDAVAHALASARLAHPALRTANPRPLWPEVVAERRLLENPALGGDGAAYDGFEFQAALRALLPREESWQAEMLAAVLPGGGKLCPAHAGMLE